MAEQNIADAVQLRASEVIFWAIKRFTGMNNYACASHTISVIDSYRPMHVFNMSNDEIRSTIRKDRLARYNR